MEETLIWVAGLIVEVLLVLTVVLAVLLQRSRKAQRQLLARLADHGKDPAQSIRAAEIPGSAAPEPVETETRAVVAAPVMATAPVDASTVDALQVELSEFDADLARPAEAPPTNEFDELRVSIDNAKLDETVYRLQQRLDATNQSLQRIALEMQQDPAGAGQAHVEIASLQFNLQEMTSEVDSLQQRNVQLQQDLRDKAQAMEQTAVERHSTKEKVLQHAKRMRGDIATLRNKLQDSEGDVQRLQSEKEALSSEFAALNREYERIYANSHK